ncbi:MAG TPA: hypothetical protein VKU00_33490, partial [Chthonomonadaceae bacterium]|nr:hypothetical protein [Chthonomonadaceae bacterium]
TGRSRREPSLAGGPPCGATLPDSNQPAACRLSSQAAPETDPSAACLRALPTDAVLLHADPAKRQGGVSPAPSGIL